MPRISSLVTFFSQDRNLFEYCYRDGRLKRENLTGASDKLEGTTNKGKGTTVFATSSDTSTAFGTALIAGGFAGTSVDVALFPIDTLKTRLQSPQGFLKAGGFRGIYNGLGAAAAGSAPGAALFFCTYEVGHVFLLLFPV